MKAAEAYDIIQKEEGKKGDQLKVRTNLIVTLRLLSFFGFVGFIYLAFTISEWMMLPMLASLIAFLLLIRAHGKARFLRDKALSRKRMASRELEMLAGDLSSFDGGQAPPPEHNYAQDLDVFGSNSLYQVLNRAFSPGGIRRVRQQLLDAPVKPREMAEWQEAAKSLSKEDEHRIAVIASASQLDIKASTLDSLMTWLGEKQTRSFQWVKPFLYSVPAYSLALIILASLSVITVNMCILGLMLPLGLVGANLKHTNHIYQELGKQGKSLEQLADLIAEVCAGATSDARSTKIREELTQAEAASRRLATLLSAYDQRNNIFASIVTNALYLAELRNAWLVTKWKNTYGKEFQDWLNSLSEYELLVSLGTFARNHEGLICWPESNASAEVEGEALIHPLLAFKKVVANDLSLTNEKKVELITGANMAGKSTYLRTVGLSVLLAQIGAPVLGSSFKLGDLQLFTSMRTEDALDSGTSCFMAELKRLNRLVETIDEDQCTFALLDEILKGTNSLDKEQGSRAFIEKLLQRNVRVVVATHDVSLTTLEQSYPTQIENHHFASEVKGEDLTFDYRMRTGVCDTMNATWLMRSMGLID
ncbi:MAG: hypothetical protein MK081_02160 [Flavobacteriales bacterium]|nr:hypothetical protein [Flavobacteriales bacterium]